MPTRWFACALSTALLAPVLVAPVWAQAPATPAPAWASAVRARVAAWQQQREIPGISVAIGRGDAVLFAEGFGLADVENDVPATAATVYRLASISKPVTAVIVLQLVESKQLDLDQDVRQLLPEFAPEHAVTLRQLLGHLGGVRHYRGEGESTEHYATQRQGLVRSVKDPLVHPPGTYLYSTYGYSLLGAAAEIATQKPFAELLRERVAVPAAAPTLRDDDPFAIVKHRAQGYQRERGELRNSELMDSSYKLGGGGLVASAPDLLRFGLLLQAGKLVQPATFAAMTTPMTDAAGKSTGYGMGLRVGTRDGHREVAHSGAQSRVSTSLLLWPDEGLGVVVMCNLEGERLQPLAGELLALVTAQ